MAVCRGARLLAYVFGYFAFRSRIRGVYFSIITQALTYALMLLFFRNETGLGGNNGLTDFKHIYGYPLTMPSTKQGLYVLSALGARGDLPAVPLHRHAKVGRVLRACATPRAGPRSPATTRATSSSSSTRSSAVLCGLAGALYVPQVGIINPSELQPSNSIEMAIWVAVGGRGTLIGAPLGAFVVNGAKSWFTVSLPELWLYMLGALVHRGDIVLARRHQSALSRLRAFVRAWAPRRGRGRVSVGEEISPWPSQQKQQQGPGRRGPGA